VSLLNWTWYIPVFQGAFLGIAAMVIHEFAHVTAAQALGVKVKAVGLDWKGLYIVRESGPPKENIIITLSGPFINLLLCVSWHWLPTFALANLCLALCNLLPISCSDGQRVLSIWQGQKARASLNSAGL